jgi:hypothetical protein
MKALFGIAGLLLVVAIVGLLARKQLTSLQAPATAPAAPGAVATQPAATPQQQVQQFKQAVDAGLQQPARAMPDESK